MGTSLSPDGVTYSTAGHTLAHQRSFGFVMWGNIEYVIDFAGMGSGGNYVRCVGSHWSSPYVAFRESYTAASSVESFSEYNRYSQTSTQMGGWVITRPAAGSLRITKTAGNYAGTMHTTIFFHGAHDIEFTSITTP